MLLLAWCACDPGPGPDPTGTPDSAVGRARHCYKGQCVVLVALWRVCTGPWAAGLGAVLLTEQVPRRSSMTAPRTSSKSWCALPGPGLTSCFKYAFRPLEAIEKAGAFTLGPEAGV